MTISEVIQQLENLRNNVGDVAVGYTNCADGFVDLVAMRADNITSVSGDPVAVHLRFEPRQT